MNIKQISKKNSCIQSHLIITFFIALFCLTIISDLNAQDITEIEQAKELFLKKGDTQKAIIKFISISENTDEPLENRFKAFIYLGWIAYRMRESEQRDKYFEQAIQLSPQLLITEIEFPPAIVEAFNETRSGYLTELTVETIPADATMELIYENEIIEPSENLTQLTKYYNLIPGDYELRVTKKSYRSRIEKITLAEGEKDARIIVEILKIRKPIYKKWWVWAILGGAGATAYIVLNHDSEEEPPILPGPPDFDSK